jgi:hypothetical protein
MRVGETRPNQAKLLGKHEVYEHLAKGLSAALRSAVLFLTSANPPIA